MVKIFLVQLHGGACVLICIYMYNILFHSGFTVRQDYFTDFEPSQSFGGAKTGDPRKESLAWLGLSHM